MVINDNSLNVILNLWKILILGSVVVLIAIYLNKDSVQSLIPICSSKLKNESCILCGGFRSVISFVEGEWSFAWQFNNGVFVMLLFLILNLFLLIIKYISKLF